MEITLTIPERYLLDYSPSEMEKRIKLYAALLMFQTGEFSAGAAAEFAEVDRYCFMEECRKRGIPVVNYPAEDLRAEVESLRRAS
jgi:predicted HTH domain antitoxin